MNRVNVEIWKRFHRKSLPPINAYLILQDLELTVDDLALKEMIELELEYLEAEFGLAGLSKGIED